MVEVVPPPSIRVKRGGNLQVEMKRCSKCQTPKETGDFYRNKAAPDGLTYWCKVCLKASNGRWLDANRDRHRDMNKVCYQQAKTQRHARRMERLHANPKARLIHTLRARTALALGSRKPASTFELLGCAPEVLRQHLERQFTAGMTWENYGQWHVDHIVPMAQINPMDQESIRRICHYTNLRPLWARENLRKGARV